MKKLLVILCLSMVFCGCGSDDDDDVITINASELTNSGGVNLYDKDGHHIFLFWNLNDLICGDSECPNKKISHKNDNSLRYIHGESTENGSVAYIRCIECSSNYYLPSGKPVENGKGNVKIYKATYNKENKTYSVWK